MKIWSIDAEGETVGVLEEGSALSALVHGRARDLSLQASGRPVPPTRRGVLPSRRRHRRPTYSSVGTAAGAGENIYAGYSQTQELTSDSDQTVMSWMHATWNIPNITIPLWVWTFIQEYPTVYEAVSLILYTTPDIDTATAAMNNAIVNVSSYEEEVVAWALFNAMEYGFRCSPWIGIINGYLGAALLQVGAGSSIQLLATASTLDGIPQFSRDEWVAFFQWTSAGEGRTFDAGPIVTGDTVKAFIHIFDDIPSVGKSEVFVYFGNETQDWYCAFVLRSTDVSAPSPLPKNPREAVWTVEQSSTAFITSDPLLGTGSRTSTGAVPMPRYGDVFFCDAVCGGWTGDSAAPVGVPFPPVGHSWPTWNVARSPSTNDVFGSLLITIPHHNHVLPGGNTRYIINDVSTSWVSLPIPVDWSPPEYWPHWPPVGSADQPAVTVPFDYHVQPGTGYRIRSNFTSSGYLVDSMAAVGYPIAVGQLAGDQLVLSSYVYAGDNKSASSFVLNAPGIVPEGAPI